MGCQFQKILNISFLGVFFDPNPEIVIENIRLTDEGIYKCFTKHSLNVIDKNGSAISGIYSGGVEITIDPRSILIFCQPKNKTVTMLEDLELKCEAESVSQPLKYQWYHEEKVLVGQCQNILNLCKVGLEQKGQYKCLVTNSVGW